MTETIKKSNNKLGFLDLVWHYKYTLAVYIVGISFVSFSVLYMIGGVPDELKVVDEAQASIADGAVQAITEIGSTTAPLSSQIGQLPTHIIISKIGVDAVVNDPDTNDNTLFDTLLLRGAVRYPGSGTLGHGNLFIFAHNTSIKIVNNQAYKTFNGLKDLVSGDTIEVDSVDTKYFYQVTSLQMVDSANALVNLSTTKNMLTLSTCNVLGEKQQRYVVQAEFISSAPL